MLWKQVRKLHAAWKINYKMTTQKAASMAAFFYLI
ncbi:hypothetical protein J2Z26_000349 [Bacillus luteolus]|nr:hypothetical protein [Cytobacillus luteolus]